MTRPAHTDDPTLRSFAEALDRALGANLLSLVRYGPIFADLHERQKHPRVDVLVVVEKLDASVTTSMREPLARASKSLDLVPVLFTEQSFLDSLDVFPVEATDIRGHYSLLMGRDLLAGIEVQELHLRHQLEFELRSKKLYLIGQLMRQQEDSAEVGQTVIAFHEAFCVLARHYLRLRGHPLVDSRSKLFELLEADPGIPPATLRKIDAISRGEQKPGPTEKANLVWGFLDAVTALILAVDRLETR